MRLGWPSSSPTQGSECSTAGSLEGKLDCTRADHDDGTLGRVAWLLSFVSSSGATAATLVFFFVCRLSTAMPAVFMPAVFVLLLRVCLIFSVYVVFGPDGRTHAT